MDCLFGYQIIGDLNKKLKDIYEHSKMSQFEKNIIREEMIAKYGRKKLKSFVNVTRNFFVTEKHCEELILLLKEEGYIKDDVFSGRFNVILQRKAKEGFLLEHIEKIKDFVIKDVSPFYNRRNNIFGIRMIDENNKIAYIKFHGEIPTRVNMEFMQLDKSGKEIPFIKDPTIISDNKQVVPKIIPRKKGEFLAEICENKDV